MEKCAQKISELILHFDQSCIMGLQSLENPVYISSYEYKKALSSFHHNVRVRIKG